MEGEEGGERASRYQGKGDAMGKTASLRTRLTWGIVTFAAIVAVAALSACSPQQADRTQASAEEGGGAEQPAVTVAWSAEGDCSTCHSKQAESQADAACLASKHADQKCVQCHTDTGALETAHAAATAGDAIPSALKQTSVDTEAVCQSCHTIEELVAATAASTALTDENGTVVNPHALPENADHAEIDCASCHKVHSSTAAEKSAQRTCSSCHHANVYECGTCHAV